MNERIAVVGLGYAGLGVALAFARKFDHVVGFDEHAESLVDLRRGLDGSHTHSVESLKRSTLRLTNDPKDLLGCTFLVVTVSPDVSPGSSISDLSRLARASEIAGRALSKGTVVVYESTVYPGVTEDVCGPILERESTLRRGVDFTVGYSSERLNHGDEELSLERVMKVVSGEDIQTLDRIASAYAAVIDAGIYRAPSIRVAEAAKAIENIQRDLNIALVNELAIIFDRMGLRTTDVLATAATKWNFLPFKPGLAGGRHIGIDPNHVAAMARQLGYQPEVLLAGRRINNGMGEFVARKTVKLLLDADVVLKRARVGILGVAFKEDCSDVRNSPVADIVRELRQFGLEAMVHDPLASPAETAKELGIKLTSMDEMHELDALLLAVSHKSYVDIGAERLCSMVRDNGVIVDVKSMIEPRRVNRGIRYWSL